MIALPCSVVYYRHMSNSLEIPRDPMPVDLIVEPNNGVPAELDIVTGDEWKSLGECKDQTDLFYSTYKSNIEAAKRICADCVVRKLCLETAVANDEAHGVWGGASETERRKMTKIQNKKA